MKSSIETIGNGISPYFPNLTTLLLSRLCTLDKGYSPDCSRFSKMFLQRISGLKVISESFFSKMQGQCTLDLGWNHYIRMLPDSISDLTCLKSLLLENCNNLEKVPYLGKMKALRELNLSGTGIKEAPQGLEELLNLRFLSMNARGLKMLPRGVLLKLVHLQHLSIPLDMQVEIEEIENLKILEEFSGGVKTMSDFNKFVRSRGDDLRYRIGVSKKVDVESAIFEMGWPKAPNNNELELHKCDFKDEKVLGKGIVHLTISRCEGVSKWLVDDLWQRFDNPTSLKRLMISYCRGIEWIMRSEDYQLSTTLEKIVLWRLNDLKGVVGVMERGEIGGFASAAAAAQPPVFSSLNSLVLYNCNKMSKLGLPAVSSFPNLEQIRISDCKELEELFQEGEGRDSATTLPKLFSLSLDNMPRLKRVSKATIISNSIRTIWIKHCPRLKNRLPLQFDYPTPPPTLREMRVERGWWESLEWDNPLLPQLLQPFLDLKD